MTFSLDGVTLEQARTNLAAWIACDLKVATDGQALMIEGDGTSTTYTRANAAWLKERIDYWRGMVRTIEAAQANNGKRRGIRVSRAVPL